MTTTTTTRQAYTRPLPPDQASLERHMDREGLECASEALKAAWRDFLPIWRVPYQGIHKNAHSPPRNRSKRLENMPRGLLNAAWHRNCVSGPTRPRPSDLERKAFEQLRRRFGVTGWSEWYAVWRRASGVTAEDETFVSGLTERHQLALISLCNRWWHEELAKG